MSDSTEKGAGAISRRGFLDGLGGTAALGSVTAQAVAGQSLPQGAALRVQPVLAWQLPKRRELSSWRPYGGLATRDDVDREARRIQEELRRLASSAEFPVEILPVSLVGSAGEAAAVKAGLEWENVSEKG